MRLVLGNRNALDADRNEVSGKRATVVDFPDGTSLGEAFTNVTNRDGVWANHASEGAAPAWVASDSAGLATLVAEHFDGVEVRDLEDPYGHLDMSGSTGGAVGTATATMVSVMLAVVLLAAALLRMVPFLKTNAGHDFQARQMANAGASASASNVAIYVAITANTTAPAAGDTTLTGEIATGGGGLVRKTGTPAHTTGTNTYTLTTTFTANGSDTLPVTIGKRGVFDQASGGLLVYSTLVSPTATLSASGDALTLTDTVTM